MQASYKQNRSMKVSSAAKKWKISTSTIYGYIKEGHVRNVAPQGTMMRVTTEEMWAAFGDPEKRKKKKKYKRQRKTHLTVVQPLPPKPKEGPIKRIVRRIFNLK